MGYIKNSYEEQEDEKRCKKDYNNYLKIQKLEKEKNELLELLIMECRNHESSEIKGYQWQKIAINLIEKIKNKKWEDVKNEV